MDGTTYSIPKKILFVFLGFLTVPVAVALEFYLSFHLGFAAVIDTIRNAGKTGIPFTDLLMDTFLDQNFLDMVSIVFAAFCILVFGVWFVLQFKKNHGSLIRGKGMNFGVILGLIFLVLGLQFVAEIVADLFSMAVPQALTDYEELMELSGMNDPTLLTWIYGVLLGPIAEELIFRGVTLHYFKRGLPFFLANLLQAALFGFYHMNLLQGVYTFVIGFIFGVIYYYGRSLIYPILAHMLFNVCGFTELIYIGSETKLYYYLWLPATVLFIVLGIVLYFEKVGAGVKQKEAGADI